MILKSYLKFLFLLIIISNLYSCRLLVPSPCENCFPPSPTPPEITDININYDDIKNDIDNLGPQSLDHISTFTIYKNNIFISNSSSGIFIFDNTDINNPKQLTFVRLANVTKMKVIGNVLYVISMGDLITLDISDLYNVKLLNRLVLESDKSKYFLTIGKIYSIKNSNEEKSTDLLNNSIDFY